MTVSESIHALLAPLLELGCGRDVLRVVARPGAVVLDRPAGSAVAAVAWEVAQHEAACEALKQGAEVLANGTIARVVGAEIVLHVAPGLDRGAFDLIGEGVLSKLASRTLDAAVALGRNVLVAGSWAASAPLLFRFVAGGARPLVIGDDRVAAPQTWSKVASVEEALSYGADRIAAPSLPAAELGVVMRQMCGVVGWIDARRLDRALMRFEASFGAQASSTLQVLSALDLVVVVATSPKWRVVEVAELVLMPEGYRPRFLFSAGEGFLSSALVPQASPSFLDELDARGFEVLADEWRHAVTPNPRVTVAQKLPAQVPEIEEAKIERELVEPSSPTTPPGWELDLLVEEPALEDKAELGGASTSNEEASLAAAYGLGPPPRPTGARPLEGPSLFEEALRQARERDF